MSFIGQLYVKHQCLLGEILLVLLDFPGTTGTVVTLLTLLIFIFKIQIICFLVFLSVKKILKAIWFFFMSKFSKFPPPLESPMSFNGFKRKFNRASSLFNEAKRFTSTARKMARVMRTATGTSRNREGPSSAITTQKDSMSIYRRRRAPRKVRRRARNRSKRHLKAQLNNINDNTNLFLDNSQAGASNLAEQQMKSITFGYIDTNNVNDDVGDWKVVFNNYLNAAADSASKSMYVTGLTYDITITNNTGTDVNNANALELDVYEFVARRDKLFTFTSGIQGMLEDSLGDETLLPGAATKMTSVTPGYTPFDSNQSMKFIIIKSKQRYYIPKGDSVSFVKNVRFSRPIKLISEDFENTSANAGDFKLKGGLTRGLILIAKGTSNSSGSLPIGSTTWVSNVQARYRFRVIDNEANKNAVGA